MPDVDVVARNELFDLTHGVVYTAAASDASIRAAALAASQAGGGTVMIPSGSIRLFSPLLAYSGVRYAGAPCQSDFIGGQTTALGGTVLIGDGTFNGIQYNSTDLNTPPTNYATFVAAMLSGTSAWDLTFLGLAYGIKIGALYNPGMKYSDFQRINCVDCTQWGAWFENYEESTFTDINCVNNAVGQIARVASGSTANYNGNSTWRHTFTQAQTNLQRATVTWARGGTILNADLSLDEEQARNGTVISQPASMTGSSTSITVTDSTQFPVGMPVTFDSTHNGFQKNEIYFVASSAANIITLTNTLGYGTPISATGSTAINILTNGFPCMEFAGLSSTDGIYAQTSSGIDAEGPCTCRMLLQNVTYSDIKGGMIASSGVNDFVTWALRNTTYSRIGSLGATTFDGDTLSKNTFFDGVRSQYGGLNFTTSRFVGMGISVNAVAGVKALNGSSAIYLLGYDAPDIYINALTNGCNFPTGPVYDYTTVPANGTINVQAGGTVVYSSASASPVNIPQITANLVGYDFVFSNPQAYTATLTTYSTQTFNNASGVTTLAVLTNTAVHLRACQLSGVFYWAHCI